jgi:hypothetical protein
MKKLKLIIKEKGRYVNIPGMAAFRTPATVDITKIKLSILLQCLHTCGVDDYQIISVSKTGEVLKTFTKNEIELPEKKIEDPQIDRRLERLENLLLTLVSKKSSQKSNNSEQITNRLSRIERMLKSGSNVVKNSFDSNTPIVEELDDHYIPTVDVSEMKISGKTTEVVSKKSKEDIDSAVDLLYSLTKNGGK